MRCTMRGRGTAIALMLAALMIAMQTALATSSGPEIHLREWHHAGGVYSVALIADVKAAPETIRVLLNDPSILPLMDTSVRTVEVLAGSPKGVRRIRTSLEGCILFLCREVTQVQDLKNPSPNEVVATNVAAQSDFKQAEYAWRIAPLGPDTTRVILTMVLEPDFFVPPGLGPASVGAQLIQRAEAMVGNLEDLARHTDG